MRQEAQRQEEGLIAAAGAYCSSFKNKTINQLSLSRHYPLAAPAAQAQLLLRG